MSRNWRGIIRPANRHRERDVSLTASCGHLVASVDDLVPVEYDDEDIDHDAGCFVPVTVSGVYCPKCAKDGIDAGHLRLIVPQTPVPDHQLATSSPAASRSPQNL